MASAMEFEALQPSAPLFLTLCSSLLAFLLFVLVTKCFKIGQRQNVPPGNLGLPLIGETFLFLKAVKSHKGVKWIEKKVAKYGPVFKTSLMGCPTVILTGSAGNRFIFQTDYNTLVSEHPTAVSKIMGERSILELSGDEHKRMRGAIMQFLKPEALVKFVSRMDSVIQRHFFDCWEGKESVIVSPLLKKLTFQVACNLLFGLQDNEEIDKLTRDFTDITKEGWSFPLNLPGTAFHRGLKARARICERLKSYCQERKRELEQKKASPCQDFMSCLLSMRDENNRGLTEEEILDNMVAVMVAGHSTICALLVNMVRMLALYPKIRELIYQEQMEILQGKQPKEALRWEDIQKMKYTWKAAQETLRLFPPFGTFRKAIKDVEYGGYTIPKGWQFLWTAGVTHMNEEIFKEPHEFDPSHFDRAIPPYNFIPFGGGPHVCPGIDFAKMETLIFLHHLVSKYNWCMVDPDEKLKCDSFPTPCMGLPIKLQSRV